MEGFFSKKQFEVAIDKKFTCITCGLFKFCESPKMHPVGEFKKGIMNIGEFPSSMDDENGELFTSKNGRILKREYAKHGIDLFEDCININALRCYPGDKEQTSVRKTNSINACRKFVLEAIEKYKPKIIVLLGDYALTSVIGHRWKKDLGSIRKWRGFTIPDQDFKAWICPVLSLSTIANGDMEVDTIFGQDMTRIASLLREPVLTFTEPVVEYIEDLSVFDTIKHGTIVFDYETTGLKPHAKGHRILCASVADSINHAWVFLLPKEKSKRAPFIRLLQNGGVGKVAHNMKFEDNWTNVRLHTAVHWWAFDTQLAAHVIDNREGITGLKFQTYVRLGIVDYDSEVHPYLESPKGAGANALNTLKEYMQTPENAQRVLKYCAWDSVNSYRIMEQQLNEMNMDFFPF